MSLIKSLLEQIDGEPIPAQKIKGQDGKLLPHPTVPAIDPIELADRETSDEFQKDLDKKAKGEAQESMTSEDGQVPHTHKYTSGKARTETEQGHDHSIIYKGGKAQSIGPGRNDGHTHGI